MEAGYKIRISHQPKGIWQLASWLSILGIFLQIPSLPLPLKSSLSLPLLLSIATMNALHSPLEALAFNYASFGFFTIVSNLWTWLALLTAALSLWKIRAKPHLPPPPPSEQRILSGPRSTADERPVESFVLHEAPGTSAAAGVLSADDGDGVTKGKFTVYYEDDRECKSDDEELTETEACCNGGCGFKSEWWEKWDNMLETKMGVKGWYKYQDLTDLNGNVVRLWDSGIVNTRFAKEVRYSSSCMVW